MQGSDETAFNMRDIGSGHGNGTSRRPGAPLQSAQTVMAQCRPDCGEGEIRRKLLEQFRQGLRDRVMASYRPLRFVKLGILGVELPYRLYSARSITLPEDPLEVRLHDPFVIHLCLP